MNGICENSLYGVCRCKNGYHLPIGLPLFDGHCHIDLFFRYGLNKNDLYTQLSNGRRIVFIDNRHQHYRWYIDYELLHDNIKIYTTFGIHPKYLSTNIDNVLNELENIFKNDVNNVTKKVGIGECGLDISSNYPLDLQLIVFKKQIN